jgi:hypothetical protein
MQPRLASLTGSQGLVLVPPPAALTVRHSTLTYVRGAVASPVCVATAVFAACVGLGYAGLIGALLATLAVMTLGASTVRYRFVQRHLDHQAELRERSRREARRLKALRPTGPVRQQQYIELRDLVEEVERVDISDAQRFELQDLLDHFVHLATSHQRCLDSLRISGGTELPAAIPITEATKSKRRREILMRRIRHRDECMRRIERLADELESVDELVRLVAQRAACPALEPDVDREIERRLWELDEMDAAMSQLSA